MLFLDPFRILQLLVFFNGNCNLYEPRLINDSYISVHLRPLLWEISLFTTLLGQWPLLITETIICMTLDLSIMYYISEMQMSPLLCEISLFIPINWSTVLFEVWRMVHNPYPCFVGNENFYVIFESIGVRFLCTR